MKILHYCMELELNVPFHASFTFVKGEINDKDTPCFEACVEAIKKTGCMWRLYETVTRKLESNEPVGEKGDTA